MSNGLGFGFLCSFPLACRELYPEVPGVSEGMVVPKEGKFQMMVLLSARDDAGTGRARRVLAGLCSHWVLMAWVMAVRVTTVHMVEGLLLAPQLTQVLWQA